MKESEVFYTTLSNSVCFIQFIHNISPLLPKSPHKQVRVDRMAKKPFKVDIFDRLHVLIDIIGQALQLGRGWRSMV